MKYLLRILKNIFQSRIGKWIIYGLIGLILFKIITFTLGIFFPPAAFILNNLFWIAIAGVGIYFFVKFKGDKTEENIEDIEHDFIKDKVKNIRFYVEDDLPKKKAKPLVRKIKPQKSEMDKLFDIIDEN